MKVLKAMKKLKFWSRKNKKKKSKTYYFTEHHPPPPPPYHCHYSWFPVEPSAPPLPASAPAAWFEYEQTHNTLSASALVSTSNQAGFGQQEIVPELNYPEKLADNASYQQYMDPNPVYGVPILPSVRREKSAGIFGFVVNFGRHFFRCLCPCFHIRDEKWIELKSK